ncbi:MAG TPA: corrinoid protein [Bacteroidales bacterium]|nr:corrinoid protein [Bacteroidales bacterium]
MTSTNELLDQLAHCIEFGKINTASPFPPEMRGQPGADELTQKALNEGITPDKILHESMVIGMERVGKKFSENKVFVPHMLMSAKAMTTAMQHIKPFFLTGAVKRKGTVIIGTVTGDLHDIGKNLVCMMIEGAGWEVIDLGVDVSAAKFISALKEKPGSIIGLSALLTTTMVNMADIVKEIKNAFPGTLVIIGGAPVNHDFCKQIGADFYSPDPRGAVEYLKSA